MRVPATDEGVMISAPPKPDEDTLRTRHTLLARLKNWDDAESWREFFDIYWRLIFNFARKAGLGDADAQDFVQDVMLSLAKKMPGFRYDPARGKFKAFLMVVVRSRLVEFWRRGASKRAHMVPLDDTTPEPCGEPDLEAIWDGEWRGAVLEAALSRVRAQVSARQFMIFDLAVVQGLDAAAIRRSLQVSAPTIYMAKLRVRRLVEKELKRIESEG